MRSQVIYSHGDPGTFDITDKDNPLYYIARYCHECSEDRYELNADGFVYEQLTSSERATKLGHWDTYMVNLESWATSAVAASVAGTSIPALPSMPGWIDIPAVDPILSHVIGIMFRLALNWLRHKLDSDTDASEVAQVLKRAFLDEDGEGDEYALIKQMANTPIEIVVSKADGFEDISYADRPET